MTDVIPEGPEHRHAGRRDGREVTVVGHVLKPGRRVSFAEASAVRAPSCPSR